MEVVDDVSRADEIDVKKVIRRERKKIVGIKREYLKGSIIIRRQGY